MNPDNNDENGNPPLRPNNDENENPGQNPPNAMPLRPSLRFHRIHRPVPVTQADIASTSGVFHPRFRVRYHAAHDNSPSTSAIVPEPDSSVSPTPFVHREAQQPPPNGPDVSVAEIESLIRPNPVPLTFNCADEMFQWFREIDPNARASNERALSPTASSNRSTANSSDTVSVPSPTSESDTQEPENLLTHSEMMDQEHRLILKWDKAIYGAKLKYYREKRRALSKKTSPNQGDTHSETDSDLDSMSESD